MARLPGFVNPDQAQYVLGRGNNGVEIFCADAEFAFYLKNCKTDRNSNAIFQFILKL